MKTTCLFLLTIIVLLIASSLVIAQGAPGPPNFPDSPDPTPIDGGLGLLAAAGGAYAWKKLKAKKVKYDID